MTKEKQAQEWRNRITECGVMPAADFIANPDNWRIHPRNQQEALGGVLDSVGWVQEVIVNKQTGHLIDGHLRVTLALRQGDQTPVPYKMVDLTLEEEALILATLDPIAAFAATDRDKLDAVMRNVQTDDARVQALMADIAEREKLEYGKLDPQDDPGAQIDKADELRQKWGVELGQLWQLGEHRLICGDCTDRAVVERVMAWEKADMVFTDPPYNVGKDYGDTTDDSLSANDYKIWSAKWFDTAGHYSDSVVFTPGAVNVWMWAEIQRPKWMAVWVKKNQVSRNGAGGYNTYEPILCYGKVKVDYDTWDIPVSLENVAHPVPKTVNAWSKIMGDILHDGVTVLDIFLGSGTTLIACERLGRKCRAVEISPAYCAVAIQRWVDMTGGEPVLVE